MKTRMRLIGFVLLMLLATGCANASAPESGKLVVVTTIGHLADAARQIGGEHVEVIGLMGPGIDPHLYVASEGDVTRLLEADVILYNGLHLEAQMAEIFEEISGSKTVLAVGETLEPAQLLSGAALGAQYDPHIWFDVALWSQAIGSIASTFAAADPENAAVYEANASAYQAELAALHTYVQEQAARLPAEQRILITAHDAFSYFGRAYGFEVRGLQGISTAAEAGTGDVQALADFIVERQVRALFIESSVPVRSIEALQAAVAARGSEVALGGELFSDALGDPATPEGSYTGMVRHNIDTIVSALAQP